MPIAAAPELSKSCQRMDAPLIGGAKQMAASSFCGNTSVDVTDKDSPVDHFDVDRLPEDGYPFDNRPRWPS